jgi:hypothetical protein
MKVTPFSILISLISIFTTGCGIFGIQIQKPSVKVVNKSALITMKTKKFAFSDSGFYTNSPDKITIQAYSSGVGLGELKFYKNENMVCIKNYCNTRKWFTDNFLSRDYPQNLILNVLDKKPIFNSKNLVKTSTGFTQKIGAIKYLVSDSKIYFKDSANRLIIKIKDN